MTIGYMLTIIFGVACMLAAPICYRLIARRESTDQNKKRRNLGAALCLMLFILGFLLVIATGTLLPEQSRIFTPGMSGDQIFRRA